MNPPQNIHTEDRLERRDRLAVLLILAVSVIFVLRANTAISHALRGTSAVGQLILLLLLPLLAILTRPVSRWRNAQHRQTNGLVWAVRERHVRFFVRSFLRWLAIIAVVGLVTAVLSNLNIALLAGFWYVVLLTSLGVSFWNLVPKHEYFTSGMKRVALAGTPDDVRSFVTTLVASRTGATRVFVVQGIAELLDGETATPVVEISRATWLSPLVGTSKRRVQMAVTAGAALAPDIDGAIILADSGAGSRALQELARRVPSKGPRLSIAIVGESDEEVSSLSKQRIRTFGEGNPSPAEILAWTVKV